MRSRVVWIFVAALLASITFTVHAADVIVEGCENAAQCDDGVFCNGVERCHVYVERGSKGQVIRRTGVCEPGDNPCQRGWQCVNREQVCKQPCEDRDGDGAHAMRCGGDDCDDNNPNRFPGNVEICDAAGIDEDCDATTVGSLDSDGDGFVSPLCR